MPQQNKPTVVSPFVPDARLEADDFRPIFREAGADPKAESAPEPAEAAPPRTAKKTPAKKAPAKKVTTAQSEPIATVVEELPPA